MDKLSKITKSVPVDQVVQVEGPVTKADILKHLNKINDDMINEGDEEAFAIKGEAEFLSAEYYITADVDEPLVNITLDDIDGEVLLVASPYDTCVRDKETFAKALDTFFTSKWFELVDETFEVDEDEYDEDDRDAPITIQRFYRLNKDQE